MKYSEIRKRNELPIAILTPTRNSDSKIFDVSLLNSLSSLPTLSMSMIFIAIGFEVLNLLTQYTFPNPPHPISFSNVSIVKSEHTTKTIISKNHYIISTTIHTQTNIRELYRQLYNSLITNIFVYSQFINLKFIIWRN
jgi:hypothetical protein